jgi:hypothetical protein
MIPTVTYRFNQTIAIIRASDRYTATELAEAVATALDDAVHRPLRGIVFDLRDSRSFAARSEADVDQLTSFMQERREGFAGRIGVVPPEHVSARVIQLVSGQFADRGIAAYVFRELSTACAWLRRRPGRADRSEATDPAAGDTDSRETGRG